MSNFLENNTVLPSGYLGESMSSQLAGFNKTYKNTHLRAGVVVQIFPISDPSNQSKLCTEYNVLVVEQMEDRGATTILYRNCIYSDSLGSISDYFEKTLRKNVSQTTKGVLPQFKGQNGAIALLQCLDGASDKAIVIGGLKHPNRTVDLDTDQPALQGEYNGINVQIAKDGSTVLTFKGQTDNNGNLVTPTQGPTTVQIATDGSFQIQHSTITFRLDKNGQTTITSSAALNINCTDANITSSGNINATTTNATVTASGTATVEGKTVKLGSGASEAVIKGKTFKQIFDAHIHPTPIGPSGVPVTPMPPSTLSTKVETE